MSGFFIRNILGLENSDNEEEASTSNQHGGASSNAATTCRTDNPVGLNSFTKL
jgi:hypothetical protein